MKKLFFIPILFLLAFCQSEKEVYVYNEPLELLVAIQINCIEANNLDAPEYFVKADSMLAILKANHPNSDEYFKARKFIKNWKSFAKN
jgi:hypothetical protein